MKTTMKTLPFVLASLLLAGSAQATGWKCLDTRCENVATEAGPTFVRLTIAHQTALYTDFCNDFARVVARHQYADGTRAALQTCTIRYQGKDIIWNSETYRFDKQLFDASYLLSIELRDSR